MKLKSTPLPILDARELGANCEACPLWNIDETKRPIPVPPTRVRNAEAIILAESPGQNEVEQRAPLVGASGRLMDKILEKIGWRRSSLWLTNTILCRPDRKLSPAEWKKARECCRPRLERELKTCKAKTVLSFGKHAMAESIGKLQVFDWMGAPTDGVGLFEGRRVLPSFHFAHALRYPEWIPVLNIFVARGFEMSKGKLSKWDWGEIVVSERDGDKAVQAALNRILTAGGTALSKTSQYGLGVDVETSGIDPLHHDLLNVGIASPDLKLAVSVSWQACSKKTKELTAKVLASKWEKACHNGQFDILSLESHGLKLVNYVFDTLHAHAVVAPRLRHKLDIVGSIEFPAPKWKAEFRQTGDKAGSNRFLTADPILRAIYNAQDCIITALLRARLWSRLVRRVHKGESQFAEYMGLNEIAYETRRHGFEIDKEALLIHRKSLQRKRRDAKRVILTFAAELGISTLPNSKGEEKIFKPGNAAHVRAMFIDKLGVQPRSYSEKTGLPSFREKDLTDLAASPSAVIRKAARNQILYRRWTKYLRTYVEGVPVAPDGKVHATPNPSGARTGRWTYQDPSLQVIPKPVYLKLKNGKERLESPGLRNMFIPSRPNKQRKVLIEADYKALEAWVLAYLSGDEALLKMLRSGDIHTSTARTVFGDRFEKADDKQRKKMRELCKTMRYSLHYGAVPTTAWAKAVVDFPDLSLSDVQRFFAAFARLHPQLIAWQKQQLANAYEHDFVEAPLSGRRFYFHGQIEPTISYNFPIQSTGADLMNACILRIWARLKKPEEMILVQVHDAIVLEAPKGSVQRVCQLVKEEMERSVFINGVEASFETELSIGSNWGTMVKLEEKKAV